MNLSDALSLIRKIPDYPKPGILFQDITPILSHPDAFNSVISALCKDLSDTDIVVGIEARGFIFASAMANRMHCGFVPLRKAGKLPFDVFSQSYRPGTLAGRGYSPEALAEMRPGIVYGGGAGIINELFKMATNGLVRVVGDGTGGVLLHEVLARHDDGAGDVGARADHQEANRRGHRSR